MREVIVAQALALCLSLGLATPVRSQDDGSIGTTAASLLDFAREGIRNTPCCSPRPMRPASASLPPVRWPTRACWWSCATLPASANRTRRFHLPASAVPVIC